jgi:hypothetical protein
VKQELQYQLLLKIKTVEKQFVPIPKYSNT